MISNCIGKLISSFRIGGNRTKTHEIKSTEVMYDNINQILYINVHGDAEIFAEKIHYIFNF